ncbi:A24 family peptidase [Prosthecomicrobium sp. N25]|uniref:A24 family peptidase n=1 Tax=Prosthecomicrobium sp. N25 TaxID=3129254 RepID=UPI00307791AB
MSLAPADALMFAAFMVIGCAAILFDLRSLRIPNWISAALAALFLVYALAHLDIGAAAQRLLLAAVVFAVGFGAWMLGIFGAGDVKLLAAYALWLGPQVAGPFALVMLGLSFAISLVMIVLKHLPWPAERAPPRFVRYAKDGTVPFGLAIGGAGLAVGPLIFS